MSQKRATLFIILFLHQTTTLGGGLDNTFRCLSSCSYIKPQLLQDECRKFHVVYHLVPTSNHNLNSLHTLLYMLFIILFLHQTTTWTDDDAQDLALFIILFLHQTTTITSFKLSISLLFIILFLHQTTTIASSWLLSAGLFIILFLHQTTTMRKNGGFAQRCLSSCSYIKPQHIATNLLIISKILCFKLLRNGRAGRILLQKY